MIAPISRRGVLIGAAALPAGCGSCGTSPARVRLQPDLVGAPIPSQLFGSNLQWTSGGDGFLTTGRNGEPVWDDALLRLVGEAGVSLLRFPGGALANTYRWRDGIGPRGARPAGKNFVGAAEPSLFGSDELIACVKRNRLEPLLTTNVAAGPEEAADWVEYMNGGPESALGRLRIRNTGAEAIGVRYWEVGNELYSPKEAGHMSPAVYGQTVSAFRDAMRRRDPTVQVGAMLEGSFQSAAWMARVMPDLLVWNSAVLKACAREIDFVSLHFSAPYDTLWSDDRLRELTLAAPLVLRKTLANVRSELERLGRPRLPILLTEYTSFYGGSRPELISGDDGALFDALVLFELMRQPTVAAAANWSFSNDGAFGLVAEDHGRLERRPAFSALRRLRAFGGCSRVALQIDGPTYSVSAKGNVPGLSNVPMLDGAAVALSSGRYRLALINRSSCRTVLAHLEDNLHIEDLEAVIAAPRKTGAGEVSMPPGAMALAEIG